MLTAEPSHIGQLQGRQRLRLDLADLVRSSLHLARATGDHEVEEQLRRLLGRLAEDRFTLALVGQYSRGKSTLVNAVLGAAFLPTGEAPMTSVVTTVRFGSRPRAWAHRRGAALPMEVPLQDIGAYVARWGRERAEQQVVSVDVEVPSDLLRLGVELVDTPGTGSDVAMNTAQTLSYLPRADAFVFVTAFDAPVTAAELDLLEQTRRHGDKLFVVVNKRDLVPGGSVDDLMRLVQERIGDHISLQGTRVFGLSALEALEGRVTAEPDRVDRSGILPFERALTDFLLADKESSQLSLVVDRAMRLVTRQRRDLELGLFVAEHKVNMQRVASRVAEREREIGRRQAELVDTMLADIDAKLPALLAIDDAQSGADLTASVGACIDAALTTEAGSAAEPVGPDARWRAVERESARRARDWLGRRVAASHERLLELVADDVGSLLDLARTAGMVDSRFIDIPAPEDDQAGRGWSLEDLPLPWVPAVEWVLPAPRTTRMRRRRGEKEEEVRRQLLDSLGAAANRYCGLALSAICEMAPEWVGRLHEMVDRETHEASGRLIQRLSTSPDSEHLEELERLDQQLSSFQAELAAICTVPDHTGSGLSSGGAPDGPVSCPICARMEQALGDALRRLQLRLATMESDRISHTDAGGFCPTHTWAYAAVASPVGISAAYAGLAQSLAVVLAALADGRTSVDALQGDLSRAVGERRCGMCTVLAEIERTEVASIARAGERCSVQVLCLAHLQHVVSSTTSATLRRRLCASAAQVLARRSEQMRLFTLKREALHSHLLDDEEETAYLDTLRLIAGPQALVRPPMTDGQIVTRL